MLECLFFIILIIKNLRRSVGHCHFTLPRKRAKDHSKHAGKRENRKGDIPARILDNRAHHNFGDNRVSEKISEKAHEAGGRTSGILRDQIEGLDPYEGDWPVDAEASQDEGYIDKYFLEGKIASGKITGLPVDQGANEHNAHKQHIRRSAASLEKL